ncbi:hypothetical protein HNR19_001342 [Nocardioides thalensis]|uniref:Fibronectin type-III domain-containing protein n=1 Tax=Nocardioides thalensis TaxID=1914755 RepID=A0A853C048_9ACTN|nr:hypothetical protein [Nocardioides thalensis]NYJ00644.1 hypothetical protein [Nocardioides thalensis]
MRTQILGTAALAAITGAVTLGLPATPAQADAWQPLKPVPFPAGVATDLTVASTGPGDAVAAAIIGGDVHVATANHGTWTHHTVVADTVATGLQLSSNGAGDTVVAWVQSINDKNKLRASRQLTPGSWSAPQTLVGDDLPVDGLPDIGVAGNGRVIATTAVSGGDVDHQLVVVEWAEGQAPGEPKVLSAADSWNPSLDVNAAGEAVIAAQYTGLIDDIVDVYVRTPGQGWELSQNAGADGNLASSVDVAMSDNGTAQVVWSAVDDGTYRIQTSRVHADGNVTKAEGFLSPADESASDPKVAIDADGAALFTWAAFKNGTKSVRYATAANNAGPGTSVLLPGTLDEAAEPTPRLSDHGLRLIQHHGSGKVMTSFRTGPQLFDSITTGNGFGQHNAVDVDTEGNAVMVGYKAGDKVYARFFDTAGPQVELTGPQGAQQLVTTFPVSWTATDSLTAISGATIIGREAAWNKTAFTEPAVLQQATGSPVDFSGDPGTTYCLAVQAKDAANNTSARTPERCTTLPLDDTSLVGGNVWKRQKEAGHYLGTVTRTDQKGAVLTRGGIRAKRLALVVQRAPKGGTLRATFSGQLLGTFALKGTGKQKLLTLAKFGKIRSGKLKLTVVSADGRKVAIDGLVVAK